MKLFADVPKGTEKQITFPEHVVGGGDGNFWDVLHEDTASISTGPCGSWDGKQNLPRFFEESSRQRGRWQSEYGKIVMTKEL